MNETQTIPAERRRHPRTQLQLTLRGIRMDPDGDLIDTLHVNDISRSGIGCYTDSAYYRGQKVILNLPQPTGAGRRNVSATIVRCRPCSDGFHVGLEFDHPVVSGWNAPTIAAAA